MCGIAGLVRTDGQPVEPAVVERMVGALRHRGPDDQGALCERNLGMGMRRLAIIDLSPLGHQPMGGEDAQVQVVFNGEIYNFRDLRSRLEVSGHRFKSHSDTEVLVHGYEELGAVELARRLEGMFAAAIYDRRQRQLHLLRGPYGIKPLYLRRSPGRLSFASEVRALAQDGAGPLRADPSCVTAYLRLGWVPSPHSAFQGVTRLEPGSVLSVDLETGREELRRFYSLRPTELPEQATEPELMDRLRELLNLAVRRQLVADVPVGVFLSGGLDSSTLAAVAARHTPGRLRTFSIGFAKSDRGDEAANAREVAERLGCANDTILVAPDAFSELERICDSLEEPLADSAVVPLWSLCRGTAAQVKVALSGEGGDEVLGGYPRYFWGQVSEQLQAAPEAWRGPVSALGHALPARSKGPLNLLRRATKFADSAALPEAARYLAWFDLFSEAERAALLPGGGPDRAAERVEGLFDEARALGLDAVQRMQYVDFRNMLLDNLLAKSDRLSMAHSLEVRVPLLDRPLAEFGLALPTWAKVGARGNKRLLRRFVESELLRSTARRPKRGFEIPVDSWFREPAARGYLEALPRGPLVSALGLSGEAIAGLCARHARGEDLGRKLFALLTLEFWARRYS